MAEEISCSTDSGCKGLGVTDHFPPLVIYDLLLVNLYHSITEDVMYVQTLSKEKPNVLNQCQPGILVTLLRSTLHVTSCTST